VCDRGTAAALGSSSRTLCTLQAASPAEKHDWLLALHNAKLALGASVVVVAAAAAALRISV